MLTLTNNDSTLIWHLRRQTPALETIVTRLTSINNMLTLSNNDTTLIWHLRRQTNALADILTALGTDTTTTGINYQIRQLLRAIQNLNFEINVGDTVTEIGEIINEAGDNLWSVLRSLIESIGSIFEVGLSELGQTVRAILSFLESILDLIVQLLIPDNLDFMGEGFESIKLNFEVKFGSFLNLGSEITDVFRPIPADFATVIQFDILGASFEPDLKLLDSVASRFRSAVSVVIWLYVASYIFRKITGKGDLINDN